MVYLHDANQISDLNLKSWTLLAPFQFLPSTLKDIAMWSLHFLFEQLLERLMSTVVQWLSSSSSSSFDSDLNYPFCSTGRPYSPPDPAADAAHSNNTPSSSSPACVGWLFPSPSGPKFSLGCSSSRTHVTIELQLADQKATYLWSPDGCQDSAASKCCWFVRGPLGHISRTHSIHLCWFLKQQRRLNRNCTYSLETICRSFCWSSEMLVV